MRLILVVFALFAVAGMPSKATSQQVELTYQRLVLEEGDNRLLFLIAYRPAGRNFHALLFDPGEPSGYRDHDLSYDCAARTYGNSNESYSWDTGRLQPTEQLARTLHRRYGIDYGAFNRVVVCERGHEGGSTIRGRQQALAEGRKWQRLNATSSVMSRFSCEQLLELMSDAMVEYGFSADFAMIRNRTLAVADSKNCEWTKDFR